MYNQQGNTKAYQGTRCQICTGCGRCFPDYKEEDLHILLGQSGGEACFPAPLNKGRRLACADIGTTTIAMQLYDEEGRVEDVWATLNPQKEYGRDVISRITAAENKDVLCQMSKQVREVLQEGLQRFRKRLKSEEELFLVIAANTTMVYLLMGYDPAELGRAPFTVSHEGGIQTRIDGVSCYIFGGLSAFVGGDITAGIVATRMTGSKETTLLIDLGTNGEMVLGNAEGLLATSTAAGPAFEGGANIGVFGADMVHLLAILRKKGLVDETGLLADPYFDEGILIGDVMVTQQSIRQIQLAKGAIRAGIEILLKESGLEETDIDRVILAGGFGYYLNPGDAVEIGLLPETFREKSKAGGNTALLGAAKRGYEILNDKGWDEKLPPVKTINLAETEGFQNLYLDFLNF